MERGAKELHCEMLGGIYRSSPEHGMDITVQAENAGNRSNRSRSSGAHNDEMSCDVQEITEECLRLVIGAGGEPVPQEDTHSDVAEWMPPLESTRNAELDLEVSSGSIGQRCLVRSSK